MLTILFWNLDGKALGGRIARLARREEADLVVLAECADPGAIVEDINATPGARFALPQSLSAKVQVIGRLPEDSVCDKFNSTRMTIRTIDHGEPPGLLLAAAHLEAKGPIDTHDQALLATEIARDIIRAETDVGHERTILVGDLNMNPFEHGAMSALALHGVMTRDIARREERTVSGRPYPFFYNPMWGCFGDRTPGPPGTFYRSASTPGNCFWNIYDQVLLRPALMDQLLDLRILTDDGESLLTRAGLPDSRNGSDHLPLLVRLNV